VLIERLYIDNLRVLNPYQFFYIYIKVRLFQADAAKPNSRISHSPPATPGQEDHIDDSLATIQTAEQDAQPFAIYNFLT
jgi:hypothetical protein